MTTWAGKSVIAVEAHPDDVELAVMGTLAKLANAGADVTICSITDGSRGGNGDPDATADQIAALRFQEATNAARVIGADFITLNAVDAYLTETLELRLQLVDILRSRKADTVFCPPPTDYQDDHTVTSTMTAQSCHLVPVGLVQTDTAALSWTPALYYYDSLFGLDFEPDFWVDISDTMDTKILCAQQHESQMQGLKTGPGWDLVDNLKALGTLRGLQSRAQYAEAFKVCPKMSRLRAFSSFPR